MTSTRLASGGRIDRRQRLSFQFDGRAYQGFAGDTLASALLANDVTIVGRSFKYHRPRGVFASGAEEPNALVQLERGPWTQPNLKATQIELYDGLTATSVNTNPRADFDLGAINDWFSPLLPAGFYYKTFMWPSWRMFEGAIRRAAGLGVAPADPDPDRYDHLHAHCDVLVIGGGPAGLAATLAAAMRGDRVILLDEQPEFGGSLLWREAEIDDRAALTWVSETVSALQAMKRVRLLSRTTAFGYYDHNLIGAVERLTDHLGPQGGSSAPRQRLWKIRAKQVVLATGAHERPLMFANNDRPGVMLADAAAQYAVRYGVEPGRRAVVFTTHDGAYASALSLLRSGVEIAAVVDVRPDGPGPAAAALMDAGVKMLSGSAVATVLGRSRVRGVRIADLVGGGQDSIACDLVCVSAGWSPTVNLWSQSGGKLRFCERRLMFVPETAVQHQTSVGAANGELSLAGALIEGWAAGGGPGGAAQAPSSPNNASPSPPAPFWFPPHRGKAFVDLANDVTTADVALAARENYVAVEHLKRYTTLGMGADQGKTANVNGLALLGALTDRSPAAVGTTKFRPPYSPVTLGAITGVYRGDLFRPRRYLPAHDWHVEHGALFEDFGGWERPAAYPHTGEDLEAAALREAAAVRGHVGLFDGSPLGKIEVSGPDAATFLDRVYVGTMSTLKTGRLRYGIVLNENGVIIDDGVIARLSPASFLVHTTSGGADRIAALMEEWLQCEWTGLDVIVVNVTAQWANLTLSGPRARSVLHRIGASVDLTPTTFPHMNIREGDIGGVPVRLLRASFTGEVSYEVNVPAGYARALFDRVWEAGRADQLTPFGVEALMIMRTEKGYIHVGADTDGATLPDDVGMAGGIAKKRSDFIGRRSLMRDEATRNDRLQLVGLASNDGRLPVGAHALGASAPPCASEGFVTSSYSSAVLGRPVALGLIRNGRARADESIRLYDMGRTYSAKIVSPTFYDPQGDRLND